MSPCSPLVRHTAGPTSTNTSNPTASPSPVGVPGLLLAGGVNFYGNEVGWAADSVVNYEIVLADSSLTNVNKAHLPDLFWALKGGSSNFGIVTRFDVETIKSPKIWGGTYTVSSQYLDQFLEAAAIGMPMVQLPGGWFCIACPGHACLLESTE